MEKIGMKSSKPPKYEKPEVMNLGALAQSESLCVVGDGYNSGACLLGNGPGSCVLGTDVGVTVCLNGLSATL